MKKVTLEQIKQVLLNTDWSGASFIGFDSLTDVVLKGGKKNPMQGMVQKVREGGLGITFSNKNKNSFEGIVNNRLGMEGKEPNFQVGQRAWGERLKDAPLVMHNGELYLEVVEAQTSVLIELGEGLGLQHKSIKKSEIKYLLNGELIDKNKIEGLEPHKGESQQGGLEESNKVIIRTYKVASLTRISFSGETYIIEG